MVRVVVTHDTETVFGGDYSERTDECLSREIVMSMLKSASRFPYASLCAAVALACSLVACGGGGSNSNGNSSPGADGGGNSDIRRSPDASNSRGQQHQSSSEDERRVAGDMRNGLLTEEAIEGVQEGLRMLIRDAFQESLDEFGDYRFTGGQVIDPAGKVHTANQWMQHVRQSCPRTAFGENGKKLTSLAPVACLAGTYIGQYPDTRQSCRVTLAQDGTVTVLHNGADRLLLRLSTANAEYGHGESAYLGAGFQQLILSGEEKQLRPSRTATAEFEMMDGVLGGRTVRMLGVSYEDSDLGPYLPAIDEDGPENEYPCMLFFDVSNPTR